MAKKKKWDMNRIMTWVIVLLMVGSVFGIMIGSFTTNNSTKYNNYKFVPVNGGYRAIIDDKPAFFRYYPGDIDHINVSKDFIQKFKETKEIDFTYDEGGVLDQQMALLEYEMGEHLGEFFGAYPVYGMTSENEYNMTIIICNENTTVPTIYLVETNETGFEERGQCLMFKSDSFEDFAMLKDRFLYAIHGIID